MECSPDLHENWFFLNNSSPAKYQLGCLSIRAVGALGSTHIKNSSCSVDHQCESWVQFPDRDINVIPLVFCGCCILFCILLYQYVFGNITTQKKRLFHVSFVSDFVCFAGENYSEVGLFLYNEGPLWLNGCCMYTCHYLKHDFPGWAIAEFDPQMRSCSYLPACVLYTPMVYFIL